MSVDANKALVRDFHQAVMVERKVEEVAQYMRDPIVHHETADKQLTLEQVKQDIQDWWASFPDLSTSIESMSGEDEKVVCHLSLMGTHQGAFMGVQPSGKAFSVSAMQIFRVVDGKIVERWNWVDLMALRSQLGIQN